MDVRLHNTSQLAGFTKRGDLAYFLRQICQAAYLHVELLAPTPDMLETYRRERGSWDAYERAFLELLRERGAADRLDRGLFAAPTALLCSEPTPEHCHRRLVAEHLRERWQDVTIVHL